jgi:hypothetical protein
VQHTAKQIATELGKYLDEIGAPAIIRERSAILSKILDIPKQLAWSLLEGQAALDPELWHKINAELEL